MASSGKPCYPRHGEIPEQAYLSPQQRHAKSADHGSVVMGVTSRRRRASAEALPKERRGARAVASPDDDEYIIGCLCQIRYLYRCLHGTPRRLFHLVSFARSSQGGTRALRPEGGCNLRSSFAACATPRHRPRRRRRREGHTRAQGRRLLQSPAVQAPLRAHGIELIEVSAPKQTDTTRAGKQVPGRRLTGPAPHEDRVLRPRASRAPRSRDRADFLRPTLARLPRRTTQDSGHRAEDPGLADRREPQAGTVFDLITCWPGRPARPTFRCGKAWCRCSMSAR